MFRFKLSEVYGQSIINETASIPAHLLGKLNFNCKLQSDVNGRKNGSFTPYLFKSELCQASNRKQELKTFIICKAGV